LPVIVEDAEEMLAEQEAQAAEEAPSEPAALAERVWWAEAPGGRRWKL